MANSIGRRGATGAAVPGGSFGRLKLHGTYTRAGRRAIAADLAAPDAPSFNQGVPGSIPGRPTSFTQ